MGHRLAPINGAEQRTERAERGAWLTRAAFVVAATLVVARATMLETLRNPLEVYPGADSVPRGPGAGTGLVLDLLACLPALLVLARRVVDSDYRLRFGWSLTPLAGLAVWTIASVAWSGDRFAAAVSGFHWVGASVLLWSTAQLVRDWKHVRLVAAICFGLLLVQLGQGFYFRYVEHPELAAQWRADRAEILRQRGWEPDSFQAAQFERRILSGEVMGFTSSENSYGAVVVLLTFVAAGVLIQRLADRDAPGWAVVVAGAVLASLAMIAHLRSRTAYATPVLGALTLASVWLLRPWLTRHARLAFAAGVAAVLLGFAAVAGHGLYHGSLPGDSLAFRWNYWSASARLLARHPLVGVGWENFGPHYLSVRLPVAAEEIRDPHNFIVRFATELGLVGLVLLMAWMVLLWRDLTVGPAAGALPNPASSSPDPPPMKRIGPGARPEGSAALRRLLVIAAGGVAINAAASIDWGQSSAFVALEVIRRLGFLCLLMVGMAVVALRSTERQDLDDRPAPWVLYGMLVALGLFLVHNLVDFSLFEPGPMSLFMFGCGAALGARLGPGPAAGGRRRATVIALVSAVVTWLALAAACAAPVAIAEQTADDGDDALRARGFERASAAYEQSLGAVPCNADYAFRAGRALLFSPDPRRHVDRILSLLDRAVALNPNRAEYWLSRADSEFLRPSPDPHLVRAGYDHALRLDPNSVQIRLDYAGLLRRLGDRGGARDQFSAALRYNDLLNPDEPKRLPPARVNEVRRAIAELSGPALTPPGPA